MNPRLTAMTRTCALFMKDSWVSSTLSLTGWVGPVCTGQHTASERFIANRVRRALPPAGVWGGEDSVVEHDTQQGAVDGERTVVAHESQFPEFVHEEVHARSRRADHLGERFLGEPGQDAM